MSRLTIAIAALLLVGAVITLVLARASRPRADEEQEEKPIASSAARVFHDAAGNVVVAIAAAAQKEIGIRTETLKPVVRPIEIEAYGFVLDPAPISKLNGDLISAQASLDASTAQYRRTSRLYTEQKNASLRDVQSAEAAYLNDKAHVESLNQQLRDSWGRQVAQIDSRARAELISALIDRREAIARVTAPIGETLDSFPSGADVFLLGHEQQPLHARAVFEAPTITPQMQGQTFLLLMGTQDFRIRPGTALSAHLPILAKSVRGVVVPRAAVVRFAGKEWIYCALHDDRFVRREIVPAEITDRGYFVKENLAPGTRIVVSGAQTLLSEELKSQIQIQD
jgi:hypothetical protein